MNDVVDVPGAAVSIASLRPNQIFAVSLGMDLLTDEQARAVVDSCARELLTPVGLRSLRSGDPAYVPRYEGGPASGTAATTRAPSGAGCWDRSCWHIGACMASRAHALAYWRPARHI